MVPCLQIIRSSPLLRPRSFGFLGTLLPPEQLHSINSRSFLLPRHVPRSLGAAIHRANGRRARSAGARGHGLVAARCRLPVHGRAVRAATTCNASGTCCRGLQLLPPLASASHHHGASTSAICPRCPSVAHRVSRPHLRSLDPSLLPAAGQPHWQHIRRMLRALAITPFHAR